MREKNRGNNWDSKSMAHSCTVRDRCGCCSGALELARLVDHNLFGGLTALRAVRLDLLDDIHTLDHCPEDHVLAVKPRSLNCGQEELGTVRVGTRVGHRQNAGTGVLESEVFIGKLSAIDGLSAGAVMVGEVAALTHEVRDHPMECRALEAEALLSRTQRPEVFGRLWGDI